MERKKFYLIGRLIFYSAIIGSILYVFSMMFCCKGDVSQKVKSQMMHFETPDLEEKLKRHVEFLAGKIGERNAFKPQKLQEASSYIRMFWENLGLQVFAQTYELEGKSYENLWVQIDGKTRPDQIILVGAHYDSVWTSPGADDNASGVGALLEISSDMGKEKPSRSIRFVAFVNEEPPFFQTENMGSAVYAKEVARKKENIVAMLSLETIGYFSDKPGSQLYPNFLRWFYPDRGNFIGIVGNLGSRKLVKKITRYFQEESDFPIECISAPRFLPGVDWSDQASFWDHGYQAIMVTDTAPYRYPHYHLASDLPNQLNYPAYARVVDGLMQVIRRLANE